MIKVNFNNTSYIQRNPSTLKRSASFTNANKNSSRLSVMSKSDISCKHRILNFNGTKINFSSEASKFFGVDSSVNIMNKLINHACLIKLKCKELGFLEEFPTRSRFSLDDPISIERTKNRIWGEMWLFDLLRKFPAARMTFSGLFSKDKNEPGLHTIGILYHPESKTLYFLDSLSGQYKEVQEYQATLKQKLFTPVGNEIQNVIFSSKPQQSINEYTCNNWTFANLEALQKALKSGIQINSAEKLNEILPDNINEILQEQYKYVIKNKSKFAFSRRIMVGDTGLEPVTP